MHNSAHFGFFIWFGVGRFRKQIWVYRADGGKMFLYDFSIHEIAIKMTRRKKYWIQKCRINSNYIRIWKINSNSNDQNIWWIQIIYEFKNSKFYYWFESWLKVCEKIGASLLVFTVRLTLVLKHIPGYLPSMWGVLQGGGGGYVNYQSYGSVACNQLLRILSTLSKTV